MVEFSADLQTQQEERYVFWLLLEGDLTLGDDLWRLLVPQFSRKIGGGVRLFGTVHLFKRIWYCIPVTFNKMR